MKCHGVNLTEGFVDVNTVPTKITCFGKWLNELDENEELVVFITGNPGMNGFYKEFVETVHRKLGWTAWMIGHAGHNDPPKNYETLVPKLEEDNKELFGLKGQIKHKIEFFEKYVPKTARVHLIGHSVGSYVIIRILEHPSVKPKVADVNLLFPTIENLALSTNGKFLIRILPKITWLVILVTSIFSNLPRIIQTFFLYIFFVISGISASEHLENIREFSSLEKLRKIYFLALECFENIRERDDRVLKKNSDKISICYGIHDGFTDNVDYKKVSECIPGMRVHVWSYDHVFVLKQSKLVGQLVSEFIEDRIKAR
ncbi:unnamed protein product [Acanthoscelides obtectus]|uniref:Lipid droplet-associated hydrolase n=1 Tax=Acanthoscelides obtectus TaxID=200917 RepID=A0A9P0Q5A1_ACAOB|nr:unnamed protein product [Acanthoscelides obtectus]CAK1638279.1 Lipid droplet-associated hydrolase [Acanthoscelides obtectus]